MVRLSAPAASDVTFHWTTMDGTATHVSRLRAWRYELDHTGGPALHFYQAIDSLRPDR